MTLTFAEQVKLILSRKKMTIKRLAEEMEAETGIKMSRQNMTQRLKRDNFQEQDMRIIARILGCQFQLSILEPLPEVIEEETVEEVLAVQEEEAVEVESEAPEETEEEISEEIGEIAEEIAEVPEEETIEEVVEGSEEEMVEELAEVQEEETVEGEIEESKEEIVEEPEEELEERDTETPEEKSNAIEMEKIRNVAIEEVVEIAPHFEENAEQGDINPYTQREYLHNSVRVHPKLIGYVQVYDRTSHAWVEMTEWAYLGFQENQRRILGKNYVEPNFLD